MTLLLTAGHPAAREYARMRVALWPMDPADNRVEVERQLSDAAWVILMEQAPDGRGLGFLELHLREYAEGAEGSPVPYVEGWFVEPPYRGQGVGRRLMGAAEEWARAAGYTEIASDSQLENESSLKAHRQLGFQEVERIACLWKRL
jgi:aminoglycoside 6'-N-acetyltransferase I